MARSKDMSIAQKAIIHAFREAGKTQNKVAVQEGCCQSANLKDKLVQNYPTVMEFPKP